MRQRIKALAILLLCVGSAASHGAGSASLKLLQTIPLPGVKGRFDHFAVDAKGRRLFVAALANNTLEVIDTGAGRRIKSISGLHKPTGVVFLSDKNQIGVANGDDGSFKLFDCASFELVNSLAGLDDADNARRDTRSGLLHVGYGDGSLGLLDGTGRKKLGGIKLPAHPESFQLETNSPRIFVNVPDAKQIVVVDRERRAVIAHWPMEKFQANFPMALDESSHRLFVGCRQPARLVVMDTGSGRPAADMEISGDTDDLFFDAKRQRLYVSCGEGFLDVIQRRAADRCERIARLPTRSGARTCFYSAELDRLFLAVPQRGGEDAEIRVYQPE